MVLESTMICVDNSDYMRNGDFVPTRLQAQRDAVSMICHSKTRSNPENNVGLLTLANVEVLATLTSDVGCIISKLHHVQPQGVINLRAGIKIAHLALKHRQGRNHKMRIVAFIGSPVEEEEMELCTLARKLKKEKVNVDMISFGEDVINADVLTTFIDTLNGKDGSGNHLVTVPSGPNLSEAIISSPIIQGEDGTGRAAVGFDDDPNDDPELALALLLSMQEQRQREEDDIRYAEDALSIDSAATSTPAIDFSNMSEEEQITFVMQMSKQDSQEASSAAQKKIEEAMDVEGVEVYSEMMDDPEFLQNVLENMPGVDPQDIRQAVSSWWKHKKKDKKHDKDNSKK